ncbi:MAG TPA: acetyl-CoA carboxylase, carboxyltransferase subunit beta [Stellaceae bacterium]|nr:acetyl-CoA carboxylase, carboxyltransferase subunit beta [Stellaceae bacterium]
MPNWLTNFVLPKIRAAVSRKEVPDNLWKQCPSCEQTLFLKDLVADLMVCRHCGHHFRIGSAERFKTLFDEAVYEKVELPKTPVDPLHFRDRKRYTERLREGQAALGAAGEAIAVAHGKIGGQGAVIAAFDFGFMGGSMGVAVGEALVAAARLAVERQSALIVVPSSGGARMQEGILSLMQMAKVSAALGRYDRAGGLYVSILTNPTMGGVAASFALQGDVTLAEPGAKIGFAGERTIWNTVRLALPEGFQTSEFLLQHGFIDRIVHRKNLRTETAQIIDYCEH